MNYQSEAGKIMTAMMAMFPSSASNYQTRETIEAAVAVLSSAMAQRKYSEKHTARAIYWASEYDNDFMPSIPRLIKFMANKMPSEIDQEYIDQRRQLARPEITEEQRAVNKQRIANLLKELKGE